MIDVDALMAAAPHAPPEVSQSEEAAATMIYTSGTTGKPKARRVNAIDPWSLSRRCCSSSGPRPTTCTGRPARSTTAAQAASWASMALGQTVVLQRKFDPEDWLRMVETYRGRRRRSPPRRRSA